MSFMQRIWNNFKVQPDSWFFYGFLLTFTLSIRKVLFFYPIAGQFNEYSGIYLYLSDIFLFMTFLAWIISLSYHKHSILSILRNINVPRGTFLLPLLFILWSFFSIHWSSNPSIAFFRSLKLLEFYFLFLYIVFQIVPPRENCSTWNNSMGARETILRNSFRIIIGIGLFQSIFGIWQFIIQHSIGLFWLKESLISPDILGVAKVIFSDTKIIRAYGLFPHPNILGGFLFLSITLTLVYKRMFHVEQLDKQKDINCSTWNISHCEVCKPDTNVPSREKCSTWNIFRDKRGTLSIKSHDSYYYLILLIQAIAIFLTFSKSAIIGLILVLIYIYKQKNVPRGTISGVMHNKMFHVEHFSRKLFLILGIILVLGIITKPDINSLFIKSLNERLLYLNVSYGTITTNLMLGVGSGQFIMNMQENVPRGTLLEAWQFQPVHNVFLLIWAELGLVGIILFLYLLYKLFHVEHSDKQIGINCSTWNISHCEVCKPDTNVPRGTFLDNVNLIIVFNGILLGFLFIMLFDHYLWDIQQGQIILWLTLGLLAGLNRQNIDNLLN